MEFLFPYQVPHVNNLCKNLETHSCAQDGSDPGTGKTISAGVIAKRLNRSLFVISPKPVISEWFDIADMLNVEIIGVTNYESIKNLKYYDSIESYLNDIRKPCPWIKKTYNKNYAFEWNLPDDVLFVFDEAHKGKNSNTINSQLLLSTRELLDKGNIKMLILSATISDKLECFHTPAILLGLAQQGKHAYNAWLRSIGGTAESIHRVVYPEYGSRMRIRDLITSADEIIANIFKNNDVLAYPYDMSPTVEKEIMEAYGSIHDAITALKEKQSVEIHHLTIILRARQRIEMLKLPTIIMLAEEYMLNGKSVAIFVNFNDSIDSMFKILDEFVQTEFHSFVTFIRGGQSSSERRYNIKSFQDDKSRLIICNINSGCVGTSLHDIHGNFGRVSLISPPSSTIILKQVLGRIHRANARTSAIQRIILSRGNASPVTNKAGITNDTTFMLNERRVGVEELMADTLNKNLRTIEWFNNGNEDDLYKI